MVCEQYGGPEVFHLKNLPQPIPKEDEILIQIKAAGVNTADWRLRKAEPAAVRLFFGLKRPKFPVLGGTFSGVVVEKGSKVTKFQIGDEIIGSAAMKFGFGTYAEYKCLPEQGVIAKKPSNTSHAEAVSMVFGFLTAWHFLHRVQIPSNGRVLLIGANGAVGLNALQLAVSKGAQVTAVAQSQHHQQLKALGAEMCVDRKDFDSLRHQKFDMILDTSGHFNVCRATKLLHKKGSLLLVSAGITQLFKGTFLRLFYGFRIHSGLIKEKSEALQNLTELVESGQLKPIIAQQFPFEKIAEAHFLAEQKGKCGTVVVTW